MSAEDWVWMGRPAHFICADKCHFRLATYIPKSKVIVSTVGDYEPGIPGMERPADIGCKRKYETFVFRAHESVDDCDCPYHIDPSGIDSLPANDGKRAFNNHMALCHTWDNKKPLTKNI